MPQLLFQDLHFPHVKIIKRLRYWKNFYELFWNEIATS
jgi:hypothetical protein